MKTRPAFAAPLKEMIEREISITSRDEGGSHLQRHLAAIAQAANSEGADSVNFKTIVFFKKKIQKGMSSFRGRDGRTNLHASTLDLLAAGSETTASLLEWVALYLASHPEKQRKVSEDEQYALAFLEEVLRHCPGLSLLSPARATTRATVFRGHRLPAGTHVHAYNGAANFDPKVFGASAKEFDPSRFMDNDGTFRLGFFAINHDSRILFFIRMTGLRRENLARSATAPADAPGRRRRGRRRSSSSGRRLGWGSPGCGGRERRTKNTLLAEEEEGRRRRRTMGGRRTSPCGRGSSPSDFKFPTHTAAALDTKYKTFMMTLSLTVLLASDPLGSLEVEPGGAGEGGGHPHLPPLQATLQLDLRHGQVRAFHV